MPNVVTVKKKLATGFYFFVVAILERNGKSIRARERL